MLKLYNFASSPFGWMARMALAEKGLQYETKEPTDRETNPELRKLNPLNRTPVLVDEGSAVFESFAVLHYLDEKYPSPPLLPKDPMARGHARAMCLLGYLYMYPEGRTISQQLFDWEHWDRKTGVFPPRKPAEKVDRAVVDPAEERLMGHFRILDRELETRKWATGDQFGMADMVLVPLAAAFKVRGRPLNDFPHVAKWYDACFARPSVRDTATPVVKQGTTV